MQSFLSSMHGNASAVIYAYLEKHNVCNPYAFKLQVISYSMHANLAGWGDEHQIL